LGEKMKKCIVYRAIILLCFCLLVGCSSASQDGSTSTADVSSISEESLHQYFQQTYDAVGNAFDTPEQLHTELSELASITAEVQSLPDDLETQYKVWRTAYMKEMFDNITKEYADVVSGRTLFDGVNPGLCYANQIDLDNNGVSELVLISFSIVDFSSDRISDNHVPTATVEVYGENQKHAVKYGESSFTWLDVLWGAIKLYQSGDKTYIGFHVVGEPSITSYRFYTVKDKSLFLADHVSEDDLESREHGPGTYQTYYIGCHGFDSGCDGEDDIQEISESQYKAILIKYSETGTLIGDQLYPDEDLYPTICSYGILEDPTGKYTLQVKVNGSLVQLNEPPKIFYRYEVNDFVAFLPAQETLEKLGMSFFEESAYDETSLVGISKEDCISIYPFGSRYDLSVYGKELSYTVSPESLYGTLYIPLTLLAEINGTQVEWNREEWIVEVTSRLNESDRPSEAEVSAIQNFTMQDAVRIAEQKGYLPHYDQMVNGSSYSGGKKWYHFLVCPLGTTEDEMYMMDFSDCLIAEVAQDGTVKIENLQ